MGRSRRTALIRTLAVLILFRVGFDLGAHGLFASDFSPVAPASPAAYWAADEGAASRGLTHDHCICHGHSTGAVAATTVEAARVSTRLVTAPPGRVPDANPHPHDRPPRQA